MVKSTTCNISIPADSNLKATEKALYEADVFPSKETVSAMLEAERIAKDSSVKGYHDVGEFFSNLDE